MSASETSLGKAERLPYNPYPLGVWNVEGISPTAKAVLGCLGAHSNYHGETILGIERKDANGQLVGGLLWKTGWRPTAVKDSIKELSLTGRITREDRRGSKWGRNSSRTKIWLTAEELKKAGAEDLSLYPVKTPEEIAAVAEANKAAATVRSEKKRNSVRGASYRGQREPKPADAAGAPQHRLSDANSIAANRLMSQSQQPSGDQVMSRLASTQQPPSEHEPSVVLPSLENLQESLRPSETKTKPKEGRSTPKKEGKTKTEEGQVATLPVPRQSSAKDRAARLADAKRGAADERRILNRQLTKECLGEPIAPSVGFRSPAVPLADRIQSQTVVPLKPDVREKLAAAGCPAAVLERLERYTKFATILNGETVGGCDNPINAYRTFAENNPEFKKQWHPNALGGPAIGESWDDIEAKRAQKRREASRTADDVERDDALRWWGQSGISDAMKAKEGVLYLGEADHDGSRLYDLLGMWRRERDTCDSYAAKIWRKKQAKAKTATP